jgi:hypothetical protein
MALQTIASKEPQLLVDLMNLNGYQHALEQLGGADGLLEWLRRSREEFRPVRAPAEKVAA